MDSFVQEFFNLMRRIGVRGWLGYLLAALLFAYVVPARWGLDFFDVYFLIAYACLPSLFVSPMVADSVLDWRSTSETEAAGPGRLYAAQVLAAAVFAWLWGLVVLAGGIAVVNLTGRMMRTVLPPTPVLVNAVLLSLGLTLLSAAAVGVLALNSKTAKEAKAFARRGFLLLLLGVVMWARMGPAELKQSMEGRLTSGRVTYTLLPAAAVCALLGAALIRTGMRRKQEEAAGPLFKL